MTYTIETMLGQLFWDADDEGLKVSFRGRDTACCGARLLRPDWSSQPCRSAKHLPSGVVLKLSWFLPGWAS